MVTTKTGRQLRTELQRFSTDGSAIVLPHFLAVSEYDETPVPRVLRWHCVPIFVAKEGAGGQVSYQGLWGNSTGRAVRINYVIVCGRTSAGAVPSKEWLEDYLNRNAVGETSQVTLEYLCSIPYAFLCTELDGTDIFTVPEGRAARIATGIGY